MNTLPCSLRHATRAALAAGLVSLLLAATPARAISLADSPLFSTINVPGNLALTLSVEFPTAVGVAHQDTTYSASSTYLGYFDPTKCYKYVFVDVETSTLMSHFAPAGVASSHLCTGTNDWLWSGNYLNWSTTQTIDPFRWAMTGGYRIVDTPSLTLLEKAYASGQGGTTNFPDKVVSSATDIANATPFVANGTLTSYIQNRKQEVAYVSSGANGTGGLLGTYFNGTNLDYSGATPVLTRTEQVNFNWGSGSPAAVVNTAALSGNYYFQTVSDDGVKLWVNGQLVINNWTPHGPTTDTSTAINVTAGQALNVRLEYFEQTGGAQIQLLWKKPGDSSFSVYDSRGGYWYVPVRAKVCDPTAPGGVESNCKAYANGYYKPEGLMQQYANNIRYSVFSYLNDSNVYRDGGVLRTQQKFIGPTYPVPGSTAVTNPAAEWDATTGVMVTNPDGTDASNTSTAYGITISNSGALNYINKFGEINRGNYKQFDPVSELYYGALRYFKNQGNVPAWSDMTGADVPTKTGWADGFPVITSWNDPIQYRCQSNFILGIGDVNTNADRNVAGSTTTGSEPALPAQVAADTTVSAVNATNQVGTMQGIANLAYQLNWPSGCCNNHSDLIAGLAYDANTNDIRSDLANMPNSIGQTVKTFWVDVLEWQVYWPNNQYYLAAKYGGFTVPTGFSPYAANATIPTSAWYTTTDTVGSGSSAQPRPDNYYTAGRPDQMVSGLTSAFAKISSQTQSSNSTALSFATPNEASNGSINYAAVYDPSNWTSSLTASTVTYDSSGNATVECARRARRRHPEQPQGHHLLHQHRRGAGLHQRRAVGGHAVEPHLLRLVLDRAGREFAVGGELRGLPARRPHAGAEQRRRLPQPQPPAGRHRQLQGHRGGAAKRHLPGRHQPRLQQLCAHLQRPRHRGLCRRQRRHGARLQRQHGQLGLRLGAVRLHPQLRLRQLQHVHHQRHCGAGQPGVFAPLLRGCHAAGV
jgi:type IV pilus assembly protein PilY1